MMMKKQLLFLLMILLPMAAGAHDIEVQNGDGVTIYYNYIYTNDGTELKVTFQGDKYDSYSNEYRGNVVIPEEVTYLNRTCKVTSIGETAFYDCPDLTSVTIPNTITSIGAMAFGKCSGLTSVTISNSVTSIGHSAFYDCTSLISVTIPNSVTYIGDSTFSGCTSLTSAIIGNGLKIISNYAFMDCKSLSSVIIGNSVTGIGSFAFVRCSSLTSIPTSNSVQNIGQFAFNGCSGLSSVTIPNCVTDIGEYAFSECTNFTSVTIPNSVTDIYQNAFEGTDITTVISQIENPMIISGKTSSSRTFSQYTFNNATLYVPKGTIEKYKATQGWKDFVSIVESDASNGVAQIAARPVLVKTDNGFITVEGADEGTQISAYTVDGVLVGTAVSRNGGAVLNTSLQPGSATIVKIGNKSVKVIMK